MLVDEDEFYGDPPDTSYGYAPKSFRQKRHYPEVH
ncbi:hypothetical protein GCK32_022105, partial [Trichostrongylus colubriformis]